MHHQSIEIETRKLHVQVLRIMLCLKSLKLDHVLGPEGNGVVRLFRNGSYSTSYYHGIVEIWYNGEWGNICDDMQYDKNEADVICHQLGYTGASSHSRAGLVR